MTERALIDVRDIAANFFVERYWSDEGAQAREYVRSRGITEETSKKLSIGYAPNHNSLRKYLHSQGIDDQAGIDAGLLRETNTGLVNDFFDEYVVFPVKGEEGTRMFASRRLPNENYTSKRFNHLFTRGNSKTIYNAEILKDPSKTHIFVVESVFNALSLMEWGYDAVATLGNANFRRHAELFRGKNVFLAFDMDFNNSGQKATIRAAKELFTVADVNPWLISMPQGIDVNDYFVNYTATDFRARILTHKIKFSHSEPFREWRRELRAKANRVIKFNSTFASRKDRANSVPVERVLAEICRVDIRKVGPNYKAMCPRTEHDETSESYTVYGKTNSVKCFGCGFYGEPVSVVSDLMNVNYAQAMNIIEQHFGLKKENR